MHEFQLIQYFWQDTAEDGAMQLSDGSDLDVGEDDVEFVDEYAGRLGFLKGPQIKEQDRYSVPSQRHCQSLC